MQGDLAVELWRDGLFWWVVVVPEDGEGVRRNESGAHNPGLPWDGYLFKKLMLTKWGARRKGAKVVAAIRADKPSEPSERILYPAGDHGLSGAAPVRDAGCWCGDC